MQEQDTENATVEGAFAKRIERLRQLHPSDIAEEIEDLELDEMREILRNLDHEVIADIIPELPQEIQTDLMENMRLERVSEIIPEMYSDEAADALGDVSPERLQTIMEQLPDEEVEDLRLDGLSRRFRWRNHAEGGPRYQGNTYARGGSRIDSPRRRSRGHQRDLHLRC